MGSILHCLFQFCCNGEEEEEESSTPQQRASLTAPARRRRVMNRAFLDSYQIAPQETRQEEDENDVVHVEDCCQPSEDGGESGLNDFFRRVRERFRMYDSLEVRDRTDTITSEEESMKAPPPSPLRTAQSFSSSGGIPSIHKEEVVLPGSELQKEMARVMAKDLEEHSGDECVICMEGFDPTNPRMPTLCDCGENRAVFHLPCLYQWIEQCDECPSCRAKLQWEEF